MCAAGTFNSHALLIGKFSAAFSTKTPQALPADSDPCPHPCFLFFALIKEPGISPSHFQCGFGPPRWEAGGWGRAGTRRGEERTRCPRSPGRAGVSPSPLDAVRVWGKAQQPCEAQGSPFWGVESSGVISRPATHSAPGGVTAAATAGSAGGCLLGVGADNALKSPDPTAKVPFVHEADGFV